MTTRATTPTRRSERALSLDVTTREMLVRRLRIAEPDVVFVKGILEASEGIAGLFAQRGGDICIAAPRGRDVELDALVADLREELGIELTDEPGASAPDEAGA